jgi:hypothetical protein
MDDDAVPPSGEAQEAREKFRVSVYRNFYDLEYEWVSQQNSSSNSSTYDTPLNDHDAPTPSTTALTTKPYIPPTEVSDDDANPFGGALDAPLA